MVLNRREFNKSLMALGISGALSGCFGSTTPDGVRLDKIRLVNFDPIEKAKIKLVVTQDGNSILENVYDVKTEDNRVSQPTIINDLPQDLGKYRIEVMNIETNASTSLEITRSSYYKCSYVDVFIVEDRISIYVKKCK